MIFLWGTYARERRAAGERAVCGRCMVECPVDFLRRWRTAHFFFFPLFSFADRLTSRCTRCGGEGVAYFPRPLPQLPLLDRLGFVFPLGGLAALFFVLLVIATSATRPRKEEAPQPVTESAKAMTDEAAASRDALEDDVELHEHHDAEEKEIASGIAAAVAGRYGNIGEVHVAVRLRRPKEPAQGDAAAARSALVIVAIDRLRKADREVREDMLETVRRALAVLLSSGDRAVVGVKGIMHYGMLAGGRVDLPWSYTKDEPDFREVDALIRSQFLADPRP